MAAPTLAINSTRCVDVPRYSKLYLEPSESEVMPIQTARSSGSTGFNTGYIREFPEVVMGELKVFHNFW